jgi:hypothetical protein
MSKMPGVSMLQIGLASPISTLFSMILCVIYFKTKKTGYLKKGIIVKIKILMACPPVGRGLYLRPAIRKRLSLL